MSLDCGSWSGRFKKKWQSQWQEWGKAETMCRCFEIRAAFGMRWSHALCVTSLACWLLGPGRGSWCQVQPRGLRGPGGMLGELLDSRLTGSTGNPGLVWRARANSDCGLYFILVFALLISLSFLSGKGNRQTCILKFVVEWWKPSAVTLKQSKFPQWKDTMSRTIFL